MKNTRRNRMVDREGEVGMMYGPKKITATMKLVATAEFYNDEESEETLRYCIEQDLEDAGFEVDVFLLKEQEPRGMTLEEVKAFGWDYCYLEEERLQGKEYRSVCGDYALTCITWPCITSMRIQYGDDSYGKKWRCWSAKPTDEQRREVKWE